MVNWFLNLLLNISKWRADICYVWFVKECVPENEIGSKNLKISMTAMWNSIHERKQNWICTCEQQWWWGTPSPLPERSYRLQIQWSGDSEILLQIHRTHKKKNQSSSNSSSVFQHIIYKSLNVAMLYYSTSEREQNSENWTRLGWDAENTDVKMCIMPTKCKDFHNGFIHFKCNY